MTKAILVCCAEKIKPPNTRTHTSLGSWCLRFLPAEFFLLRDEILCIVCLISGGLMGFFWDSFVITGPISLLCRRESENVEKKQQMPAIPKCSRLADPIFGFTWKFISPFGFQFILKAVLRKTKTTNEIFYRFWQLSVQGSGRMHAVNSW